MVTIFVIILGGSACRVQTLRFSFFTVFVLFPDLQ
jgi:hypothetical protein